MSEKYNSKKLLSRGNFSETDKKQAGLETQIHMISTSMLHASEEDTHVRGPHGHSKELSGGPQQRQACAICDSGHGPLSLRHYEVSLLLALFASAGSLGHKGTKKSIRNVSVLCNCYVLGLLYCALGRVGSKLSH